MQVTIVACDEQSAVVRDRGRRIDVAGKREQPRQRAVGCDRVDVLVLGAEQDRPVRRDAGRALAMLQAKTSNGNYLIPTPQITNIAQGKALPGPHSSLCGLMNEIHDHTSTPTKGTSISSQL